MLTIHLRPVLSIGLAMAILPAGARAGIATFDVDPARSELTLSGLVDLSGLAPGLAATFDPQIAVPDSLITSYTGSINADVSAGSIELINAMIDAQVSGTYEPNSLPGDYGITSTVPEDPPSIIAGNTIVGAVRGLVFSLSSGPLPIDGSNQFDLTNDTFADIIAGVLDTDALNQVAINGSRTNPIADVGDTFATLTSDGLLQTLELPLTMVFDNSGLEPTPLFPVEVTFSGTIVATRMIPEPSGLMLLACGLLAVTSRRCQRQRPA